MSNKCEVYFGLVGGDFDPDLVTQLVGMQPTITKRKGSPVPKYTSWWVSTGKIENDLVDVYEMSSQLICKLQPHTGGIAEAKNRLGLEAWLNVVLWITMDESKSTPAIGFRHDVISFLGIAGASIDVDTYRTA